MDLKCHHGLMARLSVVMYVSKELTKMERNEESTPKSCPNNAPPHPSQKENKGTLSKPPQYLKQAKRFVDEPEYQKAMAAKGGSSCQPTPHYSKCVTCDFRSACPELYKEAENNRIKGKRLLEQNPDSKNAKKLISFQDEQSRCIFELDMKRNKKKDLMRDYKAFVSYTPEHTLDKLHLLFTKLERCVDSDPSYTKLASLFYMMMNIYKMKFGKDSPQVAVQINNTGNPSVDIKSIMEEMRADDARRDGTVIDMPRPPSDDESDDASM